MDAYKLDTRLRDAISYLPDEVLGKILSLVPTKLAASTSVLSKKWRNVFRLVHNLDFDDSVLLQPEEGKKERDVIRESFRNFVDRTLALQCASPIKKFSLKCQIHDGREMADVGRWICNAVERGVLEMDLCLTRCCKPSPSYESCHLELVYDTGEVFLPSELFTSKTLVKLTLGDQISLGEIPGDVSLPALKSLFIESIFFTVEDLCSVLLPGCPVLEELSIHHEDSYGIPCCISSRTIKKLSVYYDSETEIDFMPGMSIDAPNLVFLDYRDYALTEYSQVNLASLVEARLDIHYSKIIKRPDLTGLIIGLSNLETLHLSPDSADAIARCVKHGLLLPVFNNLVNLSFGSNKKRGWKLLPYLVKQSPKLETLIIKGLDGFTGDVTIHPFQVKVLHVLGYGGTAKELEHLKSFLEGTVCLELVKVEFLRGLVVDLGKLFQFQKDLITLVGVAASKCKAEVAYYI